MTTIPCLTLTQPWASLVAHGLKICETRSWGTRYRGPLAIHAAAGFPLYARCTASLPRFTKPLREAGHRIDLDTRPSARGTMPLLHDLPLGAIIAVCRLVNVIRTEEIVGHLNPAERGFGDYSPGRWAWVLADVRRLPQPIPARGSLGLWSWDQPA